jgi:hypothetical protein
VNLSITFLCHIYLSPPFRNTGSALKYPHTLPFIFRHIKIYEHNTTYNAMKQFVCQNAPTQTRSIYNSININLLCRHNEPHAQRSVSCKSWV